MTKRSLIIATFFAASLATISPISAQNYSTSERGIAVFYADYMEGQSTAYGEIYHRDQLTAAHRSLPPGTLLKVTRLDNQRSVMVRVNDRGPFCDGCVVNLSKIAAVQLDMLKTGKAMVAVEVVGSRQALPSNALARNSVSSYERPIYEQPANQHSSYPRPNAGFQSSYNYTAPVTSPAGPTSYGNDQAVNTSRSLDLQPRGLNAYEQINAFDSYNYYQAQAAEERSKKATAAAGANNSTIRSDKTTYERLRARGLLPETKVPENNASFYDRAGVAQPSSYSQNEEPVVNVKGSPNPSAYIQWNNTPTSTARPENYSSQSSFPQTYRLGSTASSYAVQLASYRNFDNAQRQLKKVQQLGVKDAYLMESSNSGGPLYKVMNGHFDNKEAAINELNRCKRNLMLDGIVIMLR